MLYMWNKFLHFYWMRNQICALKSLGQINSCNWLDCIMPVEGDKSKYGTFLFYDCKSWQVISPISLTQCRPGISGHTSKNWNKTKKNSWLFKESVQYRQPGLSATVSQSEQNCFSSVLEQREAKGRQVGGWEETQRQYVESKISVFFLPRENYLQPCATWLTLSWLCFADTIDTK